jgi:hypothetical protein
VRIGIGSLSHRFDEIYFRESAPTASTIVEPRMGLWMRELVRAVDASAEPAATIAAMLLRDIPVSDHDRIFRDVNRTRKRVKKGRLDSNLILVTGAGESAGVVGFCVYASERGMSADQVVEAVTARLATSGSQQFVVVVTVNAFAGDWPGSSNVRLLHPAAGARMPTAGPA